MLTLQCSNVSSTDLIEIYFGCCWSWECWTAFPSEPLFQSEQNFSTINPGSRRLFYIELWVMISNLCTVIDDQRVSYCSKSRISSQMLYAINSLFGSACVMLVNNVRESKLCNGSIFEAYQSFLRWTHEPQLSLDQLMSFMMVSHNQIWISVWSF